MTALVFNVCPITVEISGTVNPHRFVGVNKQQCGAGANSIGVALHYGVDEPTTVETLGPVEVECGAAVTEGELVESDAQGRAIDRTTGAVLARALSGSTAAGQKVMVSLIRN